MGVVERRYIDILIIIITFSYSACISFFWQQHPYFFVHFKNVFSFFIIEVSINLHHRSDVTVLAKGEVAPVKEGHLPITTPKGITPSLGVPL